jgi:hypothetical protein
MPRVSSPQRRQTALGLTLTAGLILASASVTAGQAPSVSVEPDDIGTGSTILTVTGTGFDTGGNGVYLVFGPVSAAPEYYSDPSLYGAFRWVHAGAGASPAAAALASDGSFSTTLEVASTFTTPAGDIDCLATGCAVITFAAHGSPDRSQDTCVAIFVAGSASLTPGSSPAAGHPVTDPCEPISGGTAVASGSPGVSPAAPSATPSAP